MLRSRITVFKWCHLNQQTLFFCFNEGQCFNIIIKFAPGTGALGANICNSAIEYFKSTINSKLKSQNESNLRIKELLQRKRHFQDLP